MTQRDIAKDKEKTKVSLRDLKRSHDLWRRDAMKFQQLCEQQGAELTRLRARIRELGSAALLHNRPDVRSKQEHDMALETVFKELEELSG